MSHALSFASLLLALLCLVEGVYVFDVYRLVQYEHGGAQLGSFKTHTNLFAASNEVSTEKLTRYILIVPAEELTVQLLNDRFSPNNHTAGGLLLLLPENLSSVNLENWKAIEYELVHRKFDAPVWFARRSETVNNLYQEIKNQEARESSGGLSTNWFTGLLGADSYRLAASLSEASRVTPFVATNIEGRLNGRGKADSAATIGIFTHYDALTVAPGFPAEGDANGSGVAALLEISRLFSKLYRSTKKTQGEQNLLFVLTGAGNTNFEGTKQWLATADTKIDNLEFALCLDTIGASDKLYLHVSRLASKDPKAKKIYSTFEAVARDMQIDFSVVHKKVNISNDEIPWEHEQFSRKHVLGMTLSGNPAPPEYMLRSSLFEKQADAEILKRNTKFVSEVLARLVYGIHEESKISVFGGNLAVSSEYLEGWRQTLASSPRVAPFLNKKPVALKNIISGLVQEFKIHLNDVTAKDFTVAEPFSVFYDQIKAEMSAYRGKSAFFDGLLTLVIAIYCFFLHAALAGFNTTVSKVKKLFSSDRRRK